MSAPHLDFAIQTRATWQQGDISLIEDVQRRQGRTYKKRLGELGMVTLGRRRKAQDLLQAN